MREHDSSEAEHRSLIEAATQGDAPAKEELLLRHLPRLEGLVRRRRHLLVPGRDSATDVIQSACREALESLESFEYGSEAQFVAWLQKVVLTKLLEKRRFHHRERRDAAREVPILADGESGVTLGALYATCTSPSEHAMAAEMQARLQHCYELLSPEHQRVLFLSRVLEWSHAEIAAEMQRSEEATRALLHRALARLGLLLGAGSEGEGTRDR